jgi:hypothetical protein
MNDLILQDSLIKTVTLNAEHLKRAYQHLLPHYPFTQKFFENQTDEQYAYTDYLTTRFSKLQDIIDSKIFPLILKLQDEDITHLSYLDRLHLLEKFDFLQDAEKWCQMREVRNHLMHEYPDDLDLMAKYFNEAMIETKKLLEYWEILKIKIDKLKSKIFTA